MRVHVGFPVDYRAAVEGSCGTLHWEKVSGPAGFDLDGAGGLFYWTPAEGGRGSITVQASQSLGGYTSQDTRTFEYLADDNTIMYPPFKEYLSEPTTVTILGRAHGPDFASYTVEYADYARPEQKRLIAGPIATPVETTGVLAEWDISGLRDGGKYILFLRVQLADGSTSIVTDPVVIDRSAKPGWPKRIGPITHSVVLADLDDDGREEVLAVTHFGELYVWRIDGSLIFRTPKAGAAYSAPSVGDIDGDGLPEIVWTSIYGVYAHRLDGSLLAGFPIVAPGPNLEFRSTPTLADLDGDGRMDIIVGTQARSVDARAQVLVYAYKNAVVALPGWPREVDSFSLYASASVADLDRDGAPEIVVAAYDHVYAWRSDGSTVRSLHFTPLPSPIAQARVNSSGSLYSSSQPAIADLDGTAPTRS